MSGSISQLEQDWLAAETMADQLKSQATSADAALANALETGQTEFQRWKSRSCAPGTQLQRRLPGWRSIDYGWRRNKVRNA